MVRDPSFTACFHKLDELIVPVGNFDHKMGFYHSHMEKYDQTIYIFGINWSSLFKSAMKNSSVTVSSLSYNRVLAQVKNE